MVHPKMCPEYLGSLRYTRLRSTALRVFVVPPPAIQGSHWPESAPLTRSGLQCRLLQTQSRASLRTRRPDRGRRLICTLGPSPRCWQQTHSSGRRSSFHSPEDLPLSLLSPALLPRCLLSSAKLSKWFQCPKKSTCVREFKWVQLFCGHFYHCSLETWGGSPAILPTFPQAVQHGILFWPKTRVCQPLATVIVSSVFLKQSFWGEKQHM